MERRQFLAASLASSALALASDAAAQVPVHQGAEREFYQLRRYHLKRGEELTLTENYYKNALIPAATRMGLGPIGVFALTIGPRIPTYYALIPGRSLATLVEMDLRLRDDEEFLKAAAPFWNATDANPPFQRVEVSLMASFEGWPRLTPPAASVTKSKRIFQLRTYESPSDGEHVRKVEMFKGGEYAIFKTFGFHPLFFGDMLIGPRMPNMTYMLSFTDMNELDRKWDAEMNSEAWKKLSTSARYGFDNIVENVSNQILAPLDCSQI
jgi:NIPSNAP